MGGPLRGRRGGVQAGRQRLGLSDDLGQDVTPVAGAVHVPWLRPMSFVRRVVVEIAAVALSHAAVGLVLHGLGGAEETGAHVVHLPIAIMAWVVLVASSWRPNTFGGRVGRPALLAQRTMGLALYVAAETVMVDGFGWHVLHDPWLALAPLGVLLACGGAAALAFVGVAVLESIVRVDVDRPRGRVIRRVSLTIAAWRSATWTSPAVGRAPPSTV